MTWEIRDVSARDTHGERLRSAEFVVGQGNDRTAWIILCNFGTQNYEDYVSAHVKLVTKVRLLLVSRFLHGNSPLYVL